MNYNYTFNRELSWLSFNYRVLQEAADPRNPLYERIKFLAIFSSNLDEFFRVRVASLRSLLRLKKKNRNELNFNLMKLLKKIYKVVDKHQEEFGDIYRNRIIPELVKNNIYLVGIENIEGEQALFIKEYFKENIAINLKPLMIKKGNNRLFLKNNALYFAVKLHGLKKNKNINSKGRKNSKYALLEIPSGFYQRFINLPSLTGKNQLIFLDDLIKFCLPELFPAYKVIESYSVKLTRDAELYIDDEFSGNLLEKIKKSLAKRNSGIPARFLYDLNMPRNFILSLKAALKLSKEDLLPGGRYHNLSDFFSFPNPLSPKLEFEQMPPLKCKELSTGCSKFDVIKEKDVMINYPYQDYDYVLEFLQEAAADPHVESIQITLYRVAKDSRIINSLIEAVKNGKSVTVFVEVKARFDEESNLYNAEKLEGYGVKVLYSFPGLKVHCKICLVKRMENRIPVYYAFLSTGNFNEKTAKIYCDIGFFTSRKEITIELEKIFDYLCQRSLYPEFENLLVAPFNLRESFTNLINNEIKNAGEGKNASIILKLNSIEDKKIIKKLYEASNAGVKIKIIVRGICCLIPGVKNMSENIKVVSIVDRFLEHSRIYIFYNNGDKRYFVSSADWMTRNLDRRIELAFPVLDESIKNELHDIITIQLKDNVKARKINRRQNNPYRKSKSKKQTRAQYEIYKYLKEKNKVSEPIEKLINKASSIYIK